MYIELVKTDIVNNLKSTKRLNLTPAEHKACLSLLHNEDIIICLRQANKGSGVVILDKSEYMEKLKHEMDKRESFVETEKDLTEVAWKRVKTGKQDEKRGSD